MTSEIEFPFITDDVVSISVIPIISASQIQAWKRKGLNIKEAKNVYNSSNICGICEKTIKHNKCLDYNRVNLKIRGVICPSCSGKLNVGIIFDKELWEKTVEYLKTSEENAITPMNNELDKNQVNANILKSFGFKPRKI